jgi:uncharacterized membrane protein YhaH (DUF805 family)
MTNGANVGKAKWNDPTRDGINRVLGLISAALAIASLLYAMKYGKAASDGLKKWIVGFWILVPPVYFWFDWVALCRDIPAANVSGVKHLHDLSRNIWLALVVILIALFEITFFKPS